MKQPAVYILTNKINTVLYIGVTSDLGKRIYEHKQGFVDGFTKKYQLKKLVWYEVIEGMYEAIVYEKKLKNWKRDWKIELIEKMNPEWKDLSEDLF